MLLEHAGKAPRVHASAYVAPNAVLCGDVSVGPDARIMFGAQVIAEGAPIVLGARCIVLENAVLRATQGHPLSLGDNCLVGPHAHVVGCVVEDDVFIATGAAVFHGARVGQGSEVRIRAVVHINTVLSAGSTVPIGWVAVGTPAQLFPASEHERIWAVQQPLDFPSTVYGITRADASMAKITREMAERLAQHRSDEPVE